MTKPDWCPADVWDAAHTAIMDETYTDAHVNYLHHSVARAILAERERALEEAAVACGSFLMLNSNVDVYKVVACEEAIRALKETP